MALRKGEETFSGKRRRVSIGTATGSGNSKPDKQEEKFTASAEILPELMQRAASLAEMN